MILLINILKDGELDIPVEGGAPVRRRSINLWRPIAGIFSVNLREENVDEAPISPGPESDPYDQGPHEAIQAIPAFPKSFKIPNIFRFSFYAKNASANSTALMK